MTNAAKTIVWDAVYTPFGQVHSITGTATNNQRFPGQYADAETGFNYNYFRDYDPTTGRYIESDPIGLGGGLNTYAYVKNNPVKMIDAKGLCPDCTQAKPLQANTSKCNNYQNKRYLGASLKCFCKCAGDSKWAKQVRGCLACEFEQGTNMGEAHTSCYAAAGGTVNGPIPTLGRCWGKCIFQ